MLAVGADSGRVAIRNAPTRGWPAWVWPAIPFAIMYLIFAGVSWVLFPDMGWWSWFWVAFAGLYLVAFWLANVATIELDSSEITVRRHLRSQRASMGDVLRVDARRMPWRFRDWHGPAPYAIDVWLTGYRHWRLTYLEPEAGDRLLATLHGYQKPVWVVRTP